MSRRSFFDYDVSVTADKRRRQRARGQTGAFASSARVCECEGCEEAGAYRAPVSPERLDEFHWFCLEHVREYNRAWNFFEGQSETELEESLRNANTWERPTWKLGKGGKPQVSANGHAEGRAWARFGYRDPFEVLGENATINPGDAPPEGKRPEPRRRLLPATERRALDILGMPDASQRREIRTRYKALVKDLHPDLNGGRRDDEARLTQVLWAWDQIKSSRNFPD
ncbi:MAG: molecular chaperone DnaJ [Rhodobacteraceae bacterium]|nr:molecular chaperone DnaJ [Paracoccaceae bacterium]MBR28099.1 molecular chaperone DnaJ [Paracoccaceae bacterium]